MRGVHETGEERREEEREHGAELQEEWRWRWRLLQVDGAFIVAEEHSCRLLLVRWSSCGRRLADVELDRVWVVLWRRRRARRGASEAFQARES